MKLGFSQGNNGNGKLVLTADNLKNACMELGISDDKHTLRRAARAFDLYYSDKVGHVNDHTFKVASQYNRERPYRVQIKQTPHLKALCYAYCTCQDWMNYSGDQDLPDVNFWCKHSIAALVWLHKHSNGNGNGSKITNECGSEHAKEIQDKLNSQLPKSENSGNGDAKSPSHPMKLDVRDPFQQSEKNDIDQVEGRKNGELAWNINGKYVISYKGIMSLSQKHDITFTDGDNSNTKQVIARARLNGNERISGKLPIPSRETACELAKRNAARQLLPLVEIKAVEKKAQLESEFNWQVAYEKCSELAGGKAQVDCIINDLVNYGKLRQDNPSHYNRTEWLMIHNACKEDAESNDYDDNNDGGDNTPPSPPNDDDNWREWYNKCVEVSSIQDTSIAINQVMNNHNATYRKHLLSAGDWERIFEECKQRRETYERTQAAKANFASLQNEYKLNHIRDISGYDVKSKKYVGRPPLNSQEFIAKCQEAIAQVRAEKNTVEANEQPLEGGNGKRQLQMDKKLRTWLIEADGSKKKISCREICEQFNDGSLVTRLRAGIDDGADISTVELEN